MGFVNITEIIAGETQIWVLDHFVGDISVYRLEDVGHNFCPLAKTWYHHESDFITHDTYRFARRRDHTGVLIKMNIEEFYESLS